MKKSEISELDQNELLIKFYWIAVRSTNEVNSRKGLTKKTQKEEQYIFEEMVYRFGLDLEKLRNGIAK